MSFSEMSDKKLIIPPDVGGPLEATLMISVDEILRGLNSSEGLNVVLKWWGSDYSHHFFVGPFPENSITFYVHTKYALFKQYLKTASIKFKLLDGKKILGSAISSDVENIVSKKLFTTLLPVNDERGHKIADLRVSFKYSLIEEEEKISKVDSSAPKFSVSKIVDNTNKIRSQIASTALAECDSSLLMKRLPFVEIRTKSQEAKVIDYIQGKEMTKEEEEEALRALHCTSPLPSVLHLSRSSMETPRNQSIYESDPGSDLEKMVSKTTSSALIERGIQFSKDSIVNAFARTKNALNISIDSYRLGISKLILTNTGLRKIFNIPPYNFNGTYPTGTEFIFEYHPVSSLGKSWFRPFILTAKHFDQNVVKFNEYMISKIKNSPDPWKVVNELCEGSEIKVYWKHSNEKLPSLLGATKYPSDSSTENFSKNLCLPLYTKYKLHVGNLLMKVELGSELVFGKALVGPSGAEARGKTADKMTFRSMSEDSNVDKVPKILSKNAVTFVDKSETKKMLKTQYEFLDNQLSENLLTKLNGRSRSRVQKSNQASFSIQDEASGGQTDEPNSSSSHASLGMDSVSNLKPHSVKTYSTRKKNRKKTKLENELQVINVESGSSLQSSPERKSKKTNFFPKTLHVFKFCVDQSHEFFDDSYEFFLEYKFLNVDNNLNVFWDPKIHRIDLGFAQNSLIHRLLLPENLSLSEAFKRLEKDYLLIKFFARSITKRTYLISQLNVSLEEISFSNIKEHYGGKIVKIPWKLDSMKSIPEGVNIPFKEMSLEVFYVKNPKESDARTELEHLDDKLSRHKFLRGVDSKNWRDEFKEPAISRDPITGEPKSSRLDSKKDSKLTKLQEKYEFPLSNEDLDDFRPSSRPSFLFRPEENCFPPEVEFIDLEPTFVDENPFETPAELGKKELWTNHESNFESFSSVHQTELPINQNLMHEKVNDDVLVLSAGIDEENERGRQFKHKFDDFPSKRDIDETLYLNDEEEPKKTFFQSNVCDKVVECSKDETMKVCDEVIELSSDDEGKKKETFDVECDIFPLDGGRFKKTFSKNKSDIFNKESIDRTESDFFETYMKPIRSKIAELDKFESEEFDYRKFFRPENANQVKECGKRNFKQFSSESIENPKIFESFSVEECSVKNLNPIENHEKLSLDKSESMQSEQPENASDLKPEDLSLEDKFIDGNATKAEVIRLLKKYKKELKELSEDDTEDDIPEAEDADLSVINMEVEKEFQESKPLPKKVRVHIEVESALNLLVAVCKEKSTEGNSVLPSSRVELTTEVNGKKLALKSPWVHDARAPLYDFSVDIDLPSDMFLKKNNELEINVRAKVEGDTYFLKAMIDLTVISAGKMGLMGVYFLHLDTKACGILLANIRPLDDLDPLREAWENTFGMVAPSVQNFVSELDQFEEHYMKNLSEMHNMIEEMGEMLENKDWKRPDKEKIEKIMSFKNSSPTCLPTFIKKYSETLDDNWTAESYLKNIKKPQRTSDIEKVIDIDDCNNFSDWELEIDTAANQPNDSLDAAAVSLDKIIKELRKHRIDE